MTTALSCLGISYVPGSERGVRRACVKMRQRLQKLGMAGVKREAGREAINYRIITRLCLSTFRPNPNVARLMHSWNGRS